jgi:peroxiredoxin
LLAISVDPPARARRVVENNKLAFPILCDESREATRAFGVLHEKGSPEGQDIPLPAMFLIDREGRIRWKRVAGLIQDRPDPQEVIRSIEGALR